MEQRSRAQYSLLERVSRSTGVPKGVFIVVPSVLVVAGVAAFMQ